MLPRKYENNDGDKGFWWKFLINLWHCRFKPQNKAKNGSALFGWLNLRESCNLRFDEWVKGHSWQKVTIGNMLSP